MTQTIRALVAVDEGVDHALIQAALPAHRTEIQIVGIVDGLDEGWATLAGNADATSSSSRARAIPTASSS